MLLHIHHSNLIEDINDPDEDAQSIEVWAYLIGNKKLTSSVVCRTQQIITENQPALAPHEKGEYRRHNVYVGRKAAPIWPIVPHLMANWLLDYNKLTPKEAHIRFEHIHPFADGNGRTGRMVMWWMERKLGREPTFIDINTRDEYYKWFEKK